MSEQKKDNDLIYIDHKGELLIWLIIILVIVALFSIFKIHNNIENDDYHIFLPDVDGLIVGSPVRMMGMEVGHITQLKPMKDEVFVKFVVNDDSIKLPQGTEATVEFSGMAGSKSLELYLPEKGAYIEHDTPLLVVNPPKRLSDVYSLLYDMFRTVGNIIATSSNFAKKLKEIDMPTTGNTQNLDEFLKYTNEAIDIQQQRVNDFGRKINAKR